MLSRPCWPRRTFEHQGPSQHDGDFGVVTELDRVGFVLDVEPEPEQKLVAEVIAVRLVGGPGDFLLLPGDEHGRRRIIDGPGLRVDLRPQERLPARAEELERAVERLLEQDVQPIEDRGRTGGDEQLVGEAVPEDLRGPTLQETAILRFLLEAILGDLPRASRFCRPEGGRSSSAGQELQLDGVVTPEIAGDLDLIDAHRELERLSNYVLFELEAGVEDVIAGEPADLGAVRRRDPLPADGGIGELFEMLRTEVAGRPSRRNGNT